MCCGLVSLEAAVRVLPEDSLATELLRDCCRRVEVEDTASQVARDALVLALVDETDLEELVVSIPHVDRAEVVTFREHVPVARLDRIFHFVEELDSIGEWDLDALAERLEIGLRQVDLHAFHELVVLVFDGDELDLESERDVVGVGTGEGEGFEVVDDPAITELGHGEPPVGSCSNA